MFGISDNDDRLVRRMQRGDAAAFAAFVDQFGPRLHALSRRYALAEADAEDLTQEIVIAVCQGIGGFRRDARFSTYVYRIALNHCLKHAQRRPAAASCTLEELSLPAADPTGDPQTQAAHGELTARIGTALNTLSDGHREVVILHELHGLTYAECARVLEIPVGTVKSRLFHAFGNLRERLGSYVRGEEDAAASAPPPPARSGTVYAAGGNAGTPTAALGARR